MLARNKLRLIVWIIAVAGGLLSRCFDLGSVWLVGGLIVIFALLCTTPADAIRLPRWISESFIVVSTLIVQLLDRRWIALPLVVHLAIVLLMLCILRLWRQSPWWAVLVGWV